MQYQDWNWSSIKREISGIRGHDIEPQYQCVFYSGPGREHGYQGLRNRDRAENLAAREGTITIQRTARGSHLASRESTFKRRARKIMGEYGAEQALTQEWIITSRNLAAQAHGDVKAFVAGARKKDVFRKAELTQLIHNPRVRTLNGIPRKELHQIASSGKDGIDRAFHLVAVAGARQDMEQALRTGDRELIKDALMQMQICVNQRRIERGETLDASKAAKAKRNMKLNRRADHIAAKMQAAIRAEALQEARNYIGNRLQQGAITHEQAGHMTTRAEQSAQDPQKAYRMRELARLKQVRDNAIQGAPDIQGIHNYLNGKERYEKDLRAARQANEQRFVASNPIDKQITRRHHQRSLAGHANLKCRNRRGEIKDYAQAERELDQRLQDQRKRDLGIAEPFNRPKYKIASTDATKAHSLH